MPHKCKCEKKCGRDLVNPCKYTSDNTDAKMRALETATNAQNDLLLTYAELVEELYCIKHKSKVPIQVGPLIDNGDQGLINIDIPLEHTPFPDPSLIKLDVCDPVQNPSIRDAVICTVTNDPLGFTDRGNVDPSLVGKTTKGRTIYAARLGYGKTKVLIDAQLHGYESGSTEAIIKQLKWLTRSKSCQAQKLLETFDFLFIPRVNIDMGEPGTRQGFDNSDNFGATWPDEWGFVRYNLDVRAGGGFTEPTEPGFSGLVGIGYDLNRYNYANLRTAIRPVESQALVAVCHAFRPKWLFDMHGDAQKTTCTLNPKTFIPPFPDLAGYIEAGKCAHPAPAKPTVFDDNGKYSVFASSFAITDPKLTPSSLYNDNTHFLRTLWGNVYDQVKPKLPGDDPMARYSIFGPPFENPGFFDQGPQVLGIIGSGWESATFNPEVSFESISSVSSVEPPEYRTTTQPIIEGCLLRTTKCVHEVLLKEVLDELLCVTKNPPRTDGCYCNIPLATAINIGAFGLPPDQYVLDPKYVGPLDIVGACAGDLDTTQRGDSSGGGARSVENRDNNEDMKHFRKW